MPRRLASVALLLLVAACARSLPLPKAPPPVSVNSPNGEPLPLKAGQDDCRGALAAWFAKADTNGDGVLDQAEYLADAERWFANADLDHDGQITPDELATIRNRLAPEPEAAADDPENARRSHNMALLRRPSQVRTEPVMEADTNADFRVTKTEFRTWALSQFAARAHQGVIAQGEVLEACAKPQHHPSP